MRKLLAVLGLTAMFMSAQAAQTYNWTQDPESLFLFTAFGEAVTLQSEGTLTHDPNTDTIGSYSFAVHLLYGGSIFTLFEGLVDHDTITGGSATPIGQDLQLGDNAQSSGSLVQPLFWSAGPGSTSLFGLPDLELFGHNLNKFTLSGAWTTTDVVVPEPTTVVAGLLALIPLGAGAIRRYRAAA
jgi:hypothetical protein